MEDAQRTLLNFYLKDLDIIIITQAEADILVSPIQDVERHTEPRRWRKAETSPVA